LLSPAVEPLTPSRPKLLNGVLASLIAGLVAAIAAALALELLDRRVRDPEDLLAIAGVPVVGVLRPATSRRPVYRRLLAALPATGGPPMLGGPAGARA
jgi:capsular polysaccharide biosynthesis protein